MAQTSTLVVGLEGHQATRAVASVAEEREAAVVALGTRGPRQCDIDKLTRQRHAKGKTWHCGYEAGPWGYWRYRYRTKKELTCGVVAPRPLLTSRSTGHPVSPFRR
jgi:hypothetical protein